MTDRQGQIAAPANAISDGVFVALAVLIAEVVFAIGLPWDAYLTTTERWRVFYGALGTAGAVGLITAAMSLFARRLAPKPKLLWAIGTGTLAIGLVILGYMLTEGRRVHDSALRYPGIFAFALSGAALGQAVTVRITKSRSIGSCVGLFALGILALVIDRTVLPRLYPAFHFSLALAAWGAFFLSCVSLHAKPQPKLAFAGGLMLAGILGLGLWAWPALAKAPNARFLSERSAPYTGRVLAFFPGTEAAGSLEPETVAMAERAAPDRAEGIDLRGRDTLLITVDALRADALQAFGGDATLTPAMNRLAAEGAAFRNAYSPTPHTSYALTSLLTGKFLREVFALPDAPESHVALPEILRNYGIRTAAFYPPAVFFVDGDRFRTLRDGGFGFEYRKVMFASAEARVAQVDTYLEEVDPGRPVFVWVHFFEPHEPYEPIPEFARGDSRRARYDAEVARVDAAIGEMVQRFRAARPDATVILTADHGEEFNDHGGWYHGTTLYDEQVRVPLILSSPGRVEPGLREEPVELVDIPSTLLSALGIPPDARMRGDDLGFALAGAPPGSDLFAFASVGELRMATDGAHKAICSVSGCELYNLERDPEERRNIAGESPEVFRRLQGALSRFAAETPRIEALGLEDSAWPEALARAELGDATAAPELLPLLGHAEPSFRAAAARGLGHFEHAPAAIPLARLLEDEAPIVRIEAAIASLQFSHATDAAADLLARSLSDNETFDQETRGRVALALGTRGDARARRDVETLLASGETPTDIRLASILALERIGERASVSLVSEVLSEPNLRPCAARTLGVLGGSDAEETLLRQFEDERYLPARIAEAGALTRLGSTRAVPLIERFLGTPEPLPGGLEMLETLGVRVSAAAHLSDGWSCSDEGCHAEDGALLPVEPGRRLVLEVSAGTFEVSGQACAGDITADVRTCSFDGEMREPSGNARILRLHFVNPAEEPPPPPPEPWDPENPTPPLQGLEHDRG